MPVVHFILTALSRVVFPVFLAGFLHITWVALFDPGALVPVARFWIGALIPAFAVAYAAWAMRVRRTASGLNDRELRRAARRRFERARKLAMVDDGEFISAYVPVRWTGGPGILVLTDSRLIFLGFRSFARLPEVITDCDRLAIKSFSVRDVAFAPLDWIHGATYRRELVLEIIGVSGSQVFHCLDRGSVDSVVRRLRGQPKLPPVQNGIRRIHHLRRRGVLKRAYVRGFVPAAEPGFLRAGLLSLLWPGLGQLVLSRTRTGLLLASVFAVLVAGMADAVADSAEVRPVVVAAGFFIWLLGVLEVLVQRQIHMASASGAGNR